MIKAAEYNRDSKLIQDACNILSIEPEVITGKSRKRPIVDARIMVTNILFEFSNVGKGEGRLKHFAILVKRDHASVIHCERKHHEFMDVDKNYRSVYERLKAEINQLVSFNNMEVYTAIPNF